MFCSFLLPNNSSNIIPQSSFLLPNNSSNIIPQKVNINSNIQLFKISASSNKKIAPVTVRFFVILI